MKFFVFLAIILSFSAMGEESWQQKEARINRQLPGWIRANCSECSIVRPFSNQRQVELKIPYGRRHLQAQISELSDDKITLLTPHFGNSILDPANVYNPARARDGVRAEDDRVCKKFGPNWHVYERQDGRVSMGELREEHWKEYVTLHQLECRKGLPSWNSVIVMAGNVRDAITAPFVNDDERTSGKDVSVRQSTTQRNRSRVQGQ